MYTKVINGYMHNQNDSYYLPIAQQLYKPELSTDKDLLVVYIERLMHVKVIHLPSTYV